MNKFIEISAIPRFDSEQQMTGLIHVVRDISKRKETEKQLEHQAFYDQLTNLPNRTLFTTYLEHVNERTTRDKSYQFAVLFVDIDRFKIINDSLGHIVGDLLLIAVARRLEACIRPEDMISRFGGDEYVIFLENIKDINDTIHLADRIQNELTSPFDLVGQEVFITASIGISLSASGYNRKEDIIRDADSAMYRAKANGRACYEIFDSRMHDNAMKLLQLEADLRRAVKNQEFIVNYQPIVSLSNSGIVGVEALLRWQHPQRGIISPMEFIPLAEETGLISEIGEWILRTACAQNIEWQNAGFDPLLMKVNFSVRQFQRKDLLEVVKRAIQETMMPAQFLDVEITESIATEDNCILLLNELSAMGVQISIDDFGTGYSSLGYLKQLPINTIKIDKSFVKDISVETNAEGIVKAIIAMAHNLKIKVVAEGVETEEQKAFLKASHCDEMQGYLFSPPVSAKEFTKLLDKKRSILLS
jgi:diguanylate cyclase (GGDEF)-like protein